MMKIAAICETHFVGIVPHLLGPFRPLGAGQCAGHILQTLAHGVQTMAAAPFHMYRWD